MRNSSTVEQLRHIQSYKYNQGWAIVPGLAGHFLCPLGPGQKSAGRAGTGKIFAGLSHMVVPRDKRDRDEKSQDCAVPSLAHPYTIL